MVFPHSFAAFVAPQVLYYGNEAGCIMMRLASSIEVWTTTVQNLFRDAANCRKCLGGTVPLFCNWLWCYRGSHDHQVFPLQGNETPCSSASDRWHAIDYYWLSAPPVCPPTGASSATLARSLRQIGKTPSHQHLITAADFIALPSPRTRWQEDCRRQTVAVFLLF